MTGFENAEPVLQLRGIRLELPGRRQGALRRRAQPELPLAGVDLALSAGEVAWVVASDVTVAALSGILAGAAPTTGSVLLSGRDVTHRRRRQRSRIASQLVILAADPIDAAGIEAVVQTQPSVLVLDRGAASGEVDDGVLAALRRAADSGSAVLILDDALPGPGMATGPVHVLCGGRVVEVLGSGDVAEPMHPFARRLTGRALGEREPLPDALPVTRGGCPWRSACELAQSRCARDMPELERPLGATHPVACHFPVVRRPAQPRTVAVPRGTDGAAGEAAFGDEPTAREFADS